MSRGNTLVAGLRRFAGTVWFFPAVLGLILLAMTALRISGTSLGVYNSYFYNDAKDPALILNKPRTVRSDEWLVNTQMTLAQARDHYQRVNPNIGRGEDMSIIVDVPYKDWSEIFKPQNWSFFVLPFDYAFAFKWWLLLYLLVISVYFFILALLPGRRGVAILLSLALALSPFVQWWYQFITLAPLYYCLFAATAFIYLLKAKPTWVKWALAGAIAYLTACFALVLYPPFQIPCGLAMTAFGIGYLIEQSRQLKRSDLWQKLALLAGALLVAGVIAICFAATRWSAIKATENTIYPGKRITQTGDTSLADLFSGNLDFQLQFSARASHYVNGSRGLTNQSEASNFILLLPFLLLPSAYMLWVDHRKKRTTDWPLAAVNLLFVILLCDLFVPHLNLFAKPLFLNYVPHARLLIGLGLLNLLEIVLFIRHAASRKSGYFSASSAAVYSLVVLAAELALGFYTKHHSPGFIGLYRTISFALPIPIAIYLLLKRRFNWSVAVLCLFGAISVAGVHPLYRGTALLSSNQLTQTIQRISAHDKSRWVTESIYIEDFAVISGAPSLSATYPYPQLTEWSSIKDASQSVYNRYAHVDFIIDPNLAADQTHLQLAGPDHFNVISSPCSDFFRQNNVHYILTTRVLTSACTSVVSRINYPAQTFFIYKIK